MDLDNIALTFPGQNSHFHGMGSDLYIYDAARVVIDTATEVMGDVLGLNLREVMFSANDERLSLGPVAQTAIHTGSMATYAVLNDMYGDKIKAVAGHSFGQVAAMVSADVLSPQDGLVLVERRATFADNLFPATEEDPVYMITMLGTEANTEFKDQVEQECEYVSAEKGYVGLATINSPTMIVISGNPEAVETAASNLRARTKNLDRDHRIRYIPTDIKGPFHTPLMDDVETDLAVVMQDMQFHEPSKVVIVNGIPMTTGLDRAYLENTTTVVDFRASLEHLFASPNYQHIIQSAPGDAQGKIARRGYDMRGTEFHLADELLNLAR